VFQPNISTKHAIFDVVTTSFNNINDQLLTGLVFWTWRKPSIQSVMIFY